MKWSEWHRFASMDEHPAASCKNGVYQIRATKEDGQSVSIPRACGTDYDGILYIGEGDLCSRIGRMLNICMENPKRHHNFTAVFEDFGLSRIANRGFLEVRWCETGCHKEDERRLLYEYKKRYGDIPPGNRKLPGSPIDIADAM